MNTGNAQELKLVYIQEAKNAGYLDESLAHKEVKQFHIKGEWFTEEAMEVLNGRKD